MLFGAVWSCCTLDLMSIFVSFCCITAAPKTRWHRIWCSWSLTVALFAIWFAAVWSCCTLDRLSNFVLFCCITAAPKTRWHGIWCSWSLTVALTPIWFAAVWSCCTLDLLSNFVLFLLLHSCTKNEMTWDLVQLVAHCCAVPNLFCCSLILLHTWSIVKL